MAFRFMVDNQPVQLVTIYHDPRRVAGSKLEQPVVIEDGVHAEAAYAGEQPVEVLDTIANGELVSYRFEIQV
jgi:hypothetical protein